MPEPTLRQEAERDAELLHLAFLRLFVLTLYRPILKPTVRWLRRILPADKENPA